MLLTCAHTIILSIWISVGSESNFRRIVVAIHSYSVNNFFAHIPVVTVQSTANRLIRFVHIDFSGTPGMESSLSTCDSIRSSASRSYQHWLCQWNNRGNGQGYYDRTHRTWFQLPVDGASSGCTTTSYRSFRHEIKWLIICYSVPRSGNSTLFTRTWTTYSFIIIFRIPDTQIIVYFPGEKATRKNDRCKFGSAWIMWESHRLSTLAHSTRIEIQHMFRRLATQCFILTTTIN